MKFLHTSDWHLGASEGERMLLEDQRFFIDEICRIVQEEGVTAVVLAGDVYDRSVASSEAIRLYDYAMTKLCQECGVSVLTIAGNHDSAERLSSCSSLLEKAGLHVAGAAARAPRVIRLGNAEFFLLPWITEEKVKSLYPEERDNIHSLTDAYRTAAAHLRADFTPGLRHIAVSHAYIDGAETSDSDRAAVIGTAMQIPADVFEGFDYVALGHIHRPYSVTDAIRYCGTPMPYSFGKEESQEKSVTIVDTDTMEQKIVPLPLLHKWTTLTGTYEELLHPDCAEEVRSGYVQLKVTDTALGLETMSQLRNVYANPLVMSGKTYEGDNSSITLTMEEFEQMEHDPIAVFKSFCSEEVGEAPSEHFIALFEKAMNMSVEGNA